MASHKTPNGASIEYLRSAIKKALIGRGDYTSDLDFQIILAAGSASTYLKISNEVSKLKEMTVEVVRTNGSTATEINPLIDAQNKAAETYRRQLSELGLTPKSLGTKHVSAHKSVASSRLAPGEANKAETGDPLSELMNKINSICDD